MKKMNFIYGTVCLLLLASCKKFDCEFPPMGGGNEKKYVLKKVVHGTRQYFFHFSKKWLLDSVGVVDNKETAVYRIIRRKKRIDSVHFIRNGSRVWTNTDIEYDNAGNITRFLTHTVPGGPSPEPTIITYRNGHVHAITRISVYPPIQDRKDTLTYNQQNNVTRWSTVIPRSTFLDVKLYTYDNKWNPLYFIDDLLVVLPGSHIAPEFFLSQHNSTTKYYQLYDILVTYQNYYDAKNRLIKKTFNERFNAPLDSLTFHYVQ